MDQWSATFASHATAAQWVKPASNLETGYLCWLRRQNRIKTDESLCRQLLVIGLGTELRCNFVFTCGAWLVSQCWSWAQLHKPLIVSACARVCDGGGSREGISYTKREPFFTRKKSTSIQNLPQTLEQRQGTHLSACRVKLNFLPLLRSQSLFSFKHKFVLFVEHSHRGTKRTTIQQILTSCFSNWSRAIG